MGNLTFLGEMRRVKRGGCYVEGFDKTQLWGGERDGGKSVSCSCWIYTIFTTILSFLSKMAKYSTRSPFSFYAKD